MYQRRSRKLKEKVVSTENTRLDPDSWKEKDGD